ncbi:MAG: DUF6164 family protein [Mariprofundus sp.]|nr:DUF6164 family protein [Mariprofundus sp.]
MAVLIFKLRGVPDDEVGEVRDLLDGAEVSYYETTAGSWGISTAGIWLHDEGQVDFVKALLDKYQRQRSEQASIAYQQLRNEGMQQTLVGKIRQNPIRFVFYMSLSLFVLYVSLVPFIYFLSE